jgi:hypothetical protein
MTTNFKLTSYSDHPIGADQLGFRIGSIRTERSSDCSAGILHCIGEIIGCHAEAFWRRSNFDCLLIPFLVQLFRESVDNSSTNAKDHRSLGNMAAGP